jgi:four helix bundle protein
LATISRFEDLTAWQAARKLAVDIYKVSEQGSFANDFSLRNQIRSAAISVASNIAEGFERNGRAEFIQFLSIAKGSAGEVRCQLYLANDMKYVSAESFEQLHAEAENVSAMIAGLIRYLKQSKLRGSKYKVEEMAL